MRQTYPVMLDSRTVGTMQVEKQGLYYKFNCRCNFPSEGVYTVSARSGAHIENLGTCIPIENEFGLTTRVPAKYFPHEEMTFAAVKKGAETNGSFIPLSSNHPFSHLAELEQARFYNLDGQPGVMIRPDSCCPAKEDSVRP